MRSRLGSVVPSGGRGRRRGRRVGSRRTGYRSRRACNRSASCLGLGDDAGSLVRTTRSSAATSDGRAPPLTMQIGARCDLERPSLPRRSRRRARHRSTAGHVRPMSRHCCVWFGRRLPASSPRPRHEADRLHARRLRYPVRRDPTRRPRRLPRPRRERRCRDRARIPTPSSSRLRTRIDPLRSALSCSSNDDRRGPPAGRHHRRRIDRPLARRRLPRAPDEVVVSAVADVDAEHAEAMAAAEAARRSSPTIARCCQRPSRRGRYLPPDHLHADAIVAAAEAGLHVLCEKPMCPTNGGGYIIRHAVSAAGITFMCSHNQLFLPAVTAARKALRRSPAHLRGAVNNSFYNDFDPSTMGWRAHRSTSGGGDSSIRATTRPTCSSTSWTASPSRSSRC